MDYEELPTFDDFTEDEDEPQGLIDRGLHATESIDLKGLLDELEHTAEAKDSSHLKETPLGKLMEALPIPVLLIEQSHNIVFANQSCEKISPDYKKIEGTPFHKIFPNVKDSETAQSMVRKVFTTRKTQILEGLLMIEDRKIWGRAHIRSLKLNLDAAILVLIEDLTLEKAQLKLQQRVRKELEKRVDERTADLATTNQRLQDEISERKRVEAELMKHRAQLREMVAERTNELNNTIKRLKREIKERLQVEQSLRSSERRFNVAFRANPAMVTISTVQEGRYLEVNDSFCRTTGYTREEVISQTENDIGYWVRPSMREQMVRALLKKGALHDIEALFRAKDGKMIVGSVSADLIELDGQSYVISIIIDVTKRKQAETDRNLMTKAIEQAAESILITDPKGVIQYANPATQAVSGYSRSEILGENIKFLRSPQNEKRIMEAMQKNLSQGKAWKGHLINKKKDDSRYEVETTISPVKGQSGRITSFVAVERDVTSMARLEKQLRQAQKIEAIGTLAGGIAHDFNNILMAMMGYAQLVKDQLPEGSPLITDLKEVVTAGERARDLINQILTFSRQVEQEYRPLDVRIVFKEAVKLLRASIPATVDIKIDADKTVGHVLADATQMHQVIMNLCTNAYQAMQGQHGTLTVSVREEELTNGETEVIPTNIEPGKYVKLTVTDTGKGMTADVVERIFDPYFTTKELGEGTGMGLAIVHGIVTSHGGGITVQSEPGKGTAVHVYLPICVMSADSEEAKDTGIVMGSERILFVDDELQIANLGKRILESLGYTVSLYTDSEEALKAFRKNSTNYDLVITDLTMPKLTGEELTKELLAIREDIPVILCTGFGETLTLDRVRQLGVRDFLVKPVVPGVMSKAVRKALIQTSE